MPTVLVRLSDLAYLAINEAYTTTFGFSDEDQKQYADAVTKAKATEVADAAAKATSQAALMIVLARRRRSGGRRGGGSTRAHPKP